MPAPGLGVLSDLGSMRQKDTSQALRRPASLLKSGGHMLPSSVNAGKLSYGLSIVAGAHISSLTSSSFRSYLNEAQSIACRKFHQIRPCVDCILCEFSRLFVNSEV